MKKVLNDMCASLNTYVVRLGAI